MEALVPVSGESTGVMSDARIRHRAVLKIRDVKISGYVECLHSFCELLR